MKFLHFALAATAMAAPIQPPFAMPAAAQSADERPDITITEADRAFALANLVTTIRDRHFSATEGARIAGALARRERGGRYARITSGRELAAALTKDLREISGDPHFLVDYFARARPFPVPAGDAPDAAQQRRDLAMANFGVVAAERLDGNIGYLRIDRFGPADDCAPAIAGAMAMLGGTDALIIDLRANGGGHADTSALLAAYLLGEPAEMTDIVARDGTRQIWTPTILAPRYLGKPVYVLVSARTFSAAEGFAYALRGLGRVKIVGETTRGGANPVTRTLLSPHFWALVPVAQARSPVTGTNWGGTGVIPDIRAAAEQALAVARRDAAAALLPRHQDDALTDELKALLAAK